MGVKCLGFRVRRPPVRSANAPIRMSASGRFGTCPSRFIVKYRAHALEAASVSLEVHSVSISAPTPVAKSPIAVIEPSKSGAISITEIGQITKPSFRKLFSSVADGLANVGSAIAMSIRMQLSTTHATGLFLSFAQGCHCFIGTDEYRAQRKTLGAANGAKRIHFAL